MPRILWPLLVLLSVGCTAYGWSLGHAMLPFNAVYLTLALTIYALERWQPHEKSWLRNDGQVPADLGHTLASKGAAQVVVTMVLPGWIETPDGGLWPRQWHFAWQVVLGLVIAEFGMYWAHRIAHEFHPLWKFHSVHHSVRRLYFINTGRFHVVDTLKSMALSIPVLLFLGAPKDVMLWFGYVTAFIGILTHCNVEMKSGFLNWIFNTPELHRWHHQPNANDGNTNYGENLMLFDQLFGTYHNPAVEAPRILGIRDYVPFRFFDQLRLPFEWDKWQAFHKAGKVERFSAFDWGPPKLANPDLAAPR